eukprot:12157198-Ditylum_brightwellii.AAC.1
METKSWTTEEFLWINWHMFQRSSKSLDQQDNQIVKLTHNLLPTNLLLHKYGKLILDKCTFCKASLETIDHLVQGKSAVVTRWRESFLSHLVKHLEIFHTKPALIQILHSALRVWLQNTPVLSIPVTHAESTTIKQQTAIGWRQLFNDDMSKMWSDIQTSTSMTLNFIQDAPMEHHGPNRLSN